MKEVVLFIDDKNQEITNIDLYEALLEVDADKCEYLFIHSELSFGVFNSNLKKKELLGHILDVLKKLNVKNLLVPTFSFTFCNKEDYNVLKTKSPMGAFAEYFRKQKDAKRSLDPLMSVAMIGEDYSVIDNIGNNSCGEDCTFDLLNKKDNVKFLFMGITPAECFTFMHYVERMENVPYRYDKEFDGQIINETGDCEEKTFVLPVRYDGVEPTTSKKLHEYLLENNYSKSIALGNHSITSVDKNIGYKVVADLLKVDIDYFLASPYPRNEQSKKYTYEKKVAM